MNRTDRLVAIMLALQQRKKTPVGELARRFEVTPRTIYRDLSALAEADFPLASDRCGYGVPDGYHLPSLSFSAREATALLLGTRLVRVLTDESLKNAAEAAAVKIEGSLPSAVRSHARQLVDLVELRRPRQQHAPADGTDLLELQKATATRTAVRIRYATAGEVSERVIEPLGIIFLNEHWYVVAHCRSRQDTRIFRTDRITEAESLSEHFTPPPSFTIGSYLRDEGDEETREVVVQLRASITTVRRLKEQMPARIVSERRDGEAITLALKVASVNHAVCLVLSLGAEAELQGPEVVRQALVEELAAVQSFYGELGSAPGGGSATTPLPRSESPAPVGV